MEETKGVVKHILLARFKDDISQDRIDQLIKGYANFVSIIEPVKAFQWGKDVSRDNLHMAYTHIFESSFESLEDVAEYISDPVRLEFADEFMSALDKILVIDYQPTTVKF
ncbi:Stress-response A/B barrel domain-containing protein hs1 [Ranunculus cassubicifolius]